MERGGSLWLLLERGSEIRRDMRTLLGKVTGPCKDGLWVSEDLDVAESWVAR
jgi:hypothetical protein